VTSEPSTAQGRVADLRKELQAVEIDEAMEENTTTMHVLKPHITVDGSTDGPALGPTVYVDVLLEGQPVKALVDTGSPVTIVSIKCLLDVLEKLRAPEQIVEDWKRQMRSRFQTPILLVKNYGGGVVNIIGQISVWLASMARGIRPLSWCREEHLYMQECGEFQDQESEVLVSTSLVQPDVSRYL